MKIGAMASMTVVTAMAAHAEDTDLATKHSVIVCMEATAGLMVVPQSRAIASKMFAAIGLSIDWRRGLSSCPPEGIQINLTAEAPPGLRAGALAYALPFEGVHIRLFYDRIAQGAPAPLLPHLLAHVLVHEITHILQGFEQHSAQGVMKAQWTQGDFNEMTRRPLPFTSEDIDGIRRGIAARARSLRDQKFASNSEPPANGSRLRCSRSAVPIVGQTYAYLDIAVTLAGDLCGKVVSSPAPPERGKRP